MQRTLVLTGVAVMVAATVGLAFATEGLSSGRKIGALWSGTARRVRAFVRRAQRTPEVIEGPEVEVIEGLEA